jgi:hypothetical protein
MSRNIIFMVMYQRDKPLENKFRVIRFVICLISLHFNDIISKSGCIASMVT